MKMLFYREFKISEKPKTCQNEKRRRGLLQQEN